MNDFIRKNYINIILISLIIFSFILNITLSFRIIPIRGTVDDFQHFMICIDGTKKKNFL